MLVIIHQTYVSKISQLLFLLSVHPILLHKIIIPKFKSDKSDFCIPKKPTQIPSSVFSLYVLFLEFLSAIFLWIIFPFSKFFISTFSLFGAIPFKFFCSFSPLFSSNGSLVRRFDFFSKSSFDISTQNSTQINFIPIDSKYFFFSQNYFKILEIFLLKIFLSRKIRIKSFFPFLFEIKHKK